MASTPFSNLLLQAQYYLSKRDHSRAELAQKLIRYLLKKNQPKTNHWKDKYTVEEEEEVEEITEDLVNDFTFSSDFGKVTEDQHHTIESVLVYCAEQNWLDDLRFTEKYIENRHKKGIGKNKLKTELYQRGIDKTLIHNQLEAAEIDWFELAEQTARKKFNHLLEDGHPDAKVKIQRFLQSRGFSFDEINTIFET